MYLSNILISKSILSFVIGTIILSLIATTSCKQKELPTPDKHEFGDCLLLDVPGNPPPMGCVEDNERDSLYCSKTVIEEVFKLSAEDKRWLPYYCCEILDQITYVSASGNQTMLQVLDKNYGIVGHGKSIQKNCSEEPEKKHLYCLFSESAGVRLEFPLIEKTISVNLNIDFLYNPETDELQSGTIIKINSIQFLNPDITSFNNTTYLRTTINQGTLPERNYSNIEFYEEIELANKTFQDVHSYTNFNDSTAIKMYYNRDLGIVGFEETSGKQWRLAD